MSRMKRALLLVSFLIGFNLAFAQNLPFQDLPVDLPIIGRCLDLPDTVQRFVCVGRALAQILALIAFIVSIFFFFLAGWTFLTKGDQEAEVKKAQSRLIFTAIGLIVAILSLAISYTIARLVNYNPGR